MYLNINYEKKDKLLFVEITEEIDHHVAEKLRRKIDDDITRYMPRKTILDFSRVTFMDSAGIGMIIGRYKMMKLIGGSLEIINISTPVKKILIEQYNARREFFMYDNEMKLEFLSKSSNESFARLAVAAFASQLDPTIEELADIKTAVSEAVTNCIIHRL